MPSKIKTSSAGTFAILHPVFALTGVLHAVGGALLPSLAAALSPKRLHLGTPLSSLLRRHLARRSIVPR